MFLNCRKALLNYKTFKALSILENKQNSVVEISRGVGIY